MFTLVVIGILSGIVTGLSPCILPVLPAVLATSAIGGGPDGAAPADRRRPFVVIAGLITSFALTTLLGATILTALGLPEDLLRTVGIVALLAVGIGLLIPAVGHLLERPFARFSRVGPRRGASAFWFGATFGLAFVPCAGPVLATITVVAATNDIRAGAVVLTLAFCIGVAIPLLGFALAGQQMSERIRSVRSRMPLVRRITGAVLVATAVAVWFGVTDQVQRLVPSYVAAAQDRIEDNEAARTALAGLTESTPPPAPSPTSATPAPSATLTFDQCAAHSDQLADCGRAPELTGISTWLNTDGDTLSLAGLRGKVVLVDFWTYSCINCQRTLPHLTAWDAKYRADGLTIIGVHAPEFAFERVVGNVADQAAALGVRYPVAIDNDFATWKAYHQRFWPAHYLIDQTGVVRQVHYGEGAYDDTERLIRQLLAQPPSDPPTTASASATLATAADADVATVRTPEIYLGTARAAAYAGQAPMAETTMAYTGPTNVPANSVALDGEWTVDDERATAGNRASLRLHYRAHRVYAVLGGDGEVSAENGGERSTITVSGAPTLYPVRTSGADDGVLRLDVPAGVSVYTFTFG